MKSPISMSLLVLGALGPPLPSAVRAFDGDGQPEALAPILALENGDANGDLARDTSDGVYLLSHLFLGGPGPVPLALCGGGEPLVSNGDLNGDGSLDVSDPIHLLGWLYASGRGPVAPCGEALQGGAGGQLLRPPPIVPPLLFRPVYSHLAEEWWRWAFAAPVTGHPLFDETGELCAVGQSGPVWYLGGTFTGGAVERTCTVPRGKFIFFPVLNTECSSLEPEPFACSTRSTCLECNDQFYSGEDELSLEIDGVSIGNLQRFRVQSGLFRFVLGADNIFGLPAGTSGVSLADGYYVLIAPLPRGEHTIHWNGLFATGPLAGFGGPVTYNLVVD